MIHRMIVGLPPFEEKRRHRHRRRDTSLFEVFQVLCGGFAFGFG